MAILDFEDFSWAPTGETSNSGTLSYTEFNASYQRGHRYNGYGDAGYYHYHYPPDIYIETGSRGERFARFEPTSHSDRNRFRGHRFLYGTDHPNWQYISWRVASAYNTYRFPRGPGVVGRTSGGGFNFLYVRRKGGRVSLRVMAIGGDGEDQGSNLGTTDQRDLPSGLWRDGELNTIQLRKDDSFSPARYYYGINGVWFPEYVETDETLDRAAIGAMGGRMDETPDLGPNESVLDVEVFDFIMADEEIADCRVISTFPGADVSGEFTPSEGTDGFEMLNDDVPDGDSTYVEANTDGDEGVYDYRTREGLAPTLDEDEEILAMQFDTQARNETIDPRALEYIVEDSTGKQVVATRELEPSYATNPTFFDTNPAFFDTNPNTGAPWDKDEVMGANFGFRLVASTGS